MAIVSLFSYLVPPGRSAENDGDLKGVELPLSGSLFGMLAGLFAESEKECTIPIRFRMAPNGSQQNDVRDEVIQLLLAPSLDGSLTLAQRLYRVTTHKSGLGLLFFILGEEGAERRFVVSRFPANQGVLAEAHKGTLEVEFVERVFMKSATTYKAALYKGQSFDEDFWDATVVDKQIETGDSASYWIREFLGSEFRTTSSAGSRRIAIALRAAARSAPNLEVKQEVVAATALIPLLNGKSVSISTLFDRFNLSDPTRAAIKASLHGEPMLESVFDLDSTEFKRHAALRAVDLDNDGILMAPAENFDRVFEREVVDKANGIVRFSTVGRVVDESLRARR